MQEYGVFNRISGISGTSVGALNMALCLSDNTPEENITILKDFKASDLCDFNTVKNVAGDFIANKKKDITKKLIAVAKQYFTGKVTASLSSQKKIKEIYNKLVFDEEKLNSMELFTTVTDITPKSVRTAYVPWEDLTKDEIGKIIRSSAGMPGLYTPHKAERPMHIMIDGSLNKKIRSNTPIEPLYYLDIENLS